MRVDSSVQLYLKQINETPLLTADEEKSLARRIRRVHDVREQFQQRKCTLTEKEDAEEDAARARERMVRSNLRLVVNIAKNFKHRGMPLSDIIEEGNIGLIRAVESFDPDQDTRFSTYAAWWIKQAIKRSLINAVQPIHIPAYMVEMVARWKQTQEEFMEKEGRRPTIAEVSEHMNLPEQKVRIIKRAVKALGSNKQSRDDEEGMKLSDILHDKNTPLPQDEMFSKMESQKIQRLLEEIDDREATILRLRYGMNDEEGLTLKEIGKRIGLTRERVRQIEREALRKLNEMLNTGE